MADIAVIGMGALGSAFAHVATQAGLDVLGIDTDPDVREAIEAGEPPTDPDIREAFESVPVTDDHTKARETDLIFIFVPTRGYNPAHVFDAVEAIGDAGDGIIVVCSTVPPGTMREVSALTGAPVLYYPEFVARGTLWAGFELPMPVLIGTASRDDPHFGALLDFLDATTIDRPTPSIMTYESAELAKLAFNTFTAIKMSWANQLGIAAGRHGADAHVILDAIRDDPRIGGTKNLRPGLGFGGPCLPDDIAAYHEHVSAGHDRLAVAATGVNDDVREAVVRKVLEVADETDRVGCLGTAYKPGTAVTTGSEALEVIEALRVHRDVRSYDPMAPSETDNLYELLEWADVGVKLVPWPEFDHLNPHVDPWEGL